jgi:hypothetical protein
VLFSSELLDALLKEGLSEEGKETNNGDDNLPLPQTEISEAPATYQLPNHLLSVILSGFIPRFVTVGNLLK